MNFIPSFSVMLLMVCFYATQVALGQSQLDPFQDQASAELSGWGHLEFIPVGDGENAKSKTQFCLGQRAVSEAVELNATNGFFDRCFTAVDSMPIDAADPQTALIRQAFKAIVPTKNGREQGSARWHLKLQRSASIHVEVCLETPADTPAQSWEIHWGEQKRTVKIQSGNAGGSRKIQVQFDRPPIGVSTLKIQWVDSTPKNGTRLEKIRLTGNGVRGAYLLRARWRPSAVHQGFVPVRDATEIKPKLWVFETRSLNDLSSYSPITTPFGYFGTSLRSGGVAPGAGFNFSMWIAGRNEQRAPPVALTPHLIATGLPEATYSYFGHEGTGVKFRDAVAYPQGASRVIQAMRVEYDPELNSDVFYGYFYDETRGKWVLYASGQKPASSRRAEQVQKSGTLPFAGSFCEIPGPPSRERSGDQERVIQRRGWFYGQDDQWYPARMAPPKGRNAKIERPSLDALSDETPDRNLDSLTNKRVGYASDYVESGWITMATGGMTFGSNQWVTTEDRLRDQWPVWSPESLPEYLGQEKVEQLWQVPVEFGTSSVAEVTDSRVRITIELKKTGPQSRATLWYGPHDASVFSPQRINRGSAVLKDLFHPDRTWANSTQQTEVVAGPNLFEIENLTPATTYYYRLFVQHDEGKSWDTRSGSFTTRPAN